MDPDDPDATIPIIGAVDARQAAVITANNAVREASSKAVQVDLTAHSRAPHLRVMLNLIPQQSRNLALPDDTQRSLQSDLSFSTNSPQPRAC